MLKTTHEAAAKLAQAQMPAKYQQTFIIDMLVSLLVSYMTL
jgi:hypothetical protein